MTWPSCSAPVGGLHRINSKDCGECRWSSTTKADYCIAATAQVQVTWLWRPFRAGVPRLSELAVNRYTAVRKFLILLLP